MTAFTYDELADLCHHRIGTRDCPCPLCAGNCRSPANRGRKVLRVWHKDGFATYCCQRCGAQGYARADGGEGHRLLHREDGVGGGIHHVHLHDDNHPARQLEKARWLWRRREPLVGSPAEIYLREARVYEGAFPATLGYLRPFRPEHYPALISAFGTPDEIEPEMLSGLNPHGIHLTFLKADGSDKADLEPDKITVGPSKGWPIVVAPANDLLGLAVTEGLEDALSVHQATGLGCWAAGSAGRMPALAETMPDHIECVTIYAHADEAGQRGAEGLADGLVGRGFEVFIEGGIR